MLPTFWITEINFSRSDVICRSETISHIAPSCEQKATSIVPLTLYVGTPVGVRRLPFFDASNKSILKIAEGHKLLLGLMKGALD